MIAHDFTPNNDLIMITISLAEYRSLLVENSELKTSISHLERENDRLMLDRAEWKDKYFSKCDEIKELRHE